MTIRRYLPLILILALALSMTGCTSSPIDTMQLTVNAVEVAFPLIAPAAGIPLDTTSQVEKYLGATSQAISQASGILQGPENDAQKSALIIAAFANIAAPVVPSKYQALASAIQLVAADVAKFLASLPAPTSVKVTQLKADQTQQLEGIGWKARAARKKALHQGD